MPAIRECIRNACITMISDRRLVANLALRATAAALGFVVQIALVRLLGTSGYGNYVLFVTTCSLIFIFAGGGLDVKLLRAVSIGHAQGDRRYVVSVALTAIGLGLSFTAVWVLVFQLLRRIPMIAHWVDASIPGGEWLLPGVMAMIMLSLTMASIRGMHQFMAADTAESIIKPAAILGIITLLLLTYVPTDAEVGFIAFVGGHCVAIALCLLIAWRSLSRGTWNTNKETPQFKLIEPREATVLVFYALISYAFFQMDTLLVGMYHGAQEVAGYNMACNFVRLVIFVPLIIAARSQPVVAVLFKNRQYPELLLLVKSNLRKSLLTAVMAAALLLIVGEPLLRLVNPAFSSSYPALAVLSIAHIANSITLVITSALLMGGYQKMVVQAQLGGLLACLPLYFLLIPRFATVGAAIAVLVGLTINLSLLVEMVRRRVRNMPQDEIRISEAEPI